MAYIVCGESQILIFNLCEFFQMEGMVTDLQLAREKQREFKEWVGEHEEQMGIDMGVQVLTTGFWPTYKATDLAFPEEIAEGVRVFKVHPGFLLSAACHSPSTFVYSQVRSLQSICRLCCD